MATVPSTRYCLSSGNEIVAPSGTLAMKAFS